jgi:hypothetical protein
LSAKQKAKSFIFELKAESEKSKADVECCIACLSALIFLLLAFFFALSA